MQNIATTWAWALIIIIDAHSGWIQLLFTMLARLTFSVASDDSSIRWTLLVRSQRVMYWQHGSVFWIDCTTCINKKKQNGKTKWLIICRKKSSPRFKFDWSLFLWVLTPDCKSALIIIMDWISHHLDHWWSNPLIHTCTTSVQREKMFPWKLDYICVLITTI